MECARRHLHCCSSIVPSFDESHILCRGRLHQSTHRPSSDSSSHAPSSFTTWGAPHDSHLWFVGVCWVCYCRFAPARSECLAHHHDLESLVRYCCFCHHCCFGERKVVVRQVKTHFEFCSNDSMANHLSRKAAEELKLRLLKVLFHLRYT